MKKNLYNTPVGVRKWMREFRELNVNFGFETKKMEMETTRMLSSENPGPFTLIPVLSITCSH